VGSAQGTACAGRRDLSLRDVPFNVGSNIYLHVQFDDLADVANINVGAYQTTFNSTSLTTNWLGDAGLSTGIPSTLQQFFVVAAANSNVVLDVHCTNASCTGGLANVLVTGYLDPSEFGQQPRRLLKHTRQCRMPAYHLRSFDWPIRRHALGVPSLAGQAIPS
jgi:hypothetical protein